MANKRQAAPPAPPAVVLLSAAQQRTTQQMNKALLASKRFTAWSFSRLKDYHQCPRFAAWKHLLRQGKETEESPQMARGSAVHKGAEDYVLGKTKKVLPELQPVKTVLAQLAKRRRSVAVEQQWGFNRQWEVCAWDDWKNCWLRVKMDVHYVVGELLEMIDWKTGKVKPEEHKEQLKLYGVTGLKRFPAVERAHGVLHYTDHGVKDELTVVRREERSLVKFWEGEVKPMFNDTRFAPKPGPKCRYCPFSRERGGACQF